MFRWTRSFLRGLWLIGTLLTACMIGTGASSSLTFNLPYGQRKCFMEDLPPSSTVQGTVHVSSGHGDMSLDMFVSNSKGTVFYHRSDVNSIKFSFHTPGHPNFDNRRSGNPYDTRNVRYYNEVSADTYRFCVVNQVHPQAAASPGVVRRITLDISHISDQYSAEVSKLAKQEHAEKIFSTFSDVSKDVDNLIEQLDDLRAKEQTLSELNESTSTTILTISLLASLFTILTGVINFLSLKSFFKRKKLA